MPHPQAPFWVWLQKDLLNLTVPVFSAISFSAFVNQNFPACVSVRAGWKICVDELWDSTARFDIKGAFLTYSF